VQGWYSVDPKAESFYSLSPYNSMNNNPISFNDPEGDLPFLAVVGIGAATGIFGNGLNNISNGQGFFDGAGKAALWGGIGAAASVGIGAAAGGIFGQGTSFGKAAFQFGAHGLSNGLQSHLQGGSFGQGFLSGSISSGLSSSATALNFGDAGMIGIGGIGGGIGAAIGGGSFFDGMTQGLLVSGFNHALHSGAEAIESSLDNGDPPWIKRLLRKRDAEAMANAYGGDASSYYERLRGIEGDAAVDAVLLGSSFTGIGVGFGIMSKSARIGTMAYNSRLIGYQSKLFGRYHSVHLPKGFQGYFNRHKLRIGWSSHNSRHVFRVAAGKPHTLNKFDILKMGPKF